MKEADRVNYRLQLDPVILCNALLQGNQKGPPEKRWAPINMPTKNHETDIDPYEYIYMDYRCENPEDKENTSNFNDTIYKTWPNNSKFRGVDRLKLIALILKARISEGGCQIDCYKLIKNKCMISFFPLHDAVELLELEDKWLQGYPCFIILDLLIVVIVLYTIHIIITLLNNYEFNPLTHSIQSFTRQRVSCRGVRTWRR